MLSINWKGYRFAAWMGQTLIGIAVLAAAIRGKWQNAIALALFLVVSLVFVVKDDTRRSIGILKDTLLPKSLRFPFQIFTF